MKQDEPIAGDDGPARPCPIDFCQTLRGPLAGHASASGGPL